MQNIKIEDLLDFRFLSSPTLSADGKLAMVIFSACKPDQMGYRKSLQVLSATDGTIIWQAPEDGIQCAAFAGNSYIAYVHKEEDGTRELVRAKLDGTSEESRITLSICPQAIVHLGGSLFLMHTICEYREEKCNAGQGTDWEIVDELPFLENGRGYVSKTRRSLMLFDADNGDIVQITPKWFETASFSFDAKHRRVIYTGSEFTDVWQTRDGVYTYDLVEQQTRVLVCPGIYRVRKAVALGEVIIMAASLCERYHASENPCFYSIDPNTLDIRIISDPDLMPMGLGIASDCRYGGGNVFSVEGDALYFTATEMHNCNLYRMTLDGDVARIPLEEGSVDSFDIRNDSILYVGMHGERLQELYRAGLNGMERRLTGVNEAYYKSHIISRPQSCDFINNAGQTVQGFVLQPKRLEGRRKYPAILNIHGGPKTAYGTVYNHEMQYWCARGYYVIYCNPRGSDGRGNAFGDLIERYGTIDYDDIMKFVDTVLERYPDIDASRLGVTGGSYGGYMTNWIVGHTERFAAAVTQRSISNYLVDEGTSDGGFHFMPHMYAPSPRISFDKAWNQSPLQFAKQIKTPMLFIHADEDFRCPLAGALMLYTAVINNGVPARMCIFKGENHELSRSGRPYNRIKRIREITAWMDCYLQPDCN